MENECYTCKNCGKKYKSFSNLIKHEEKATCFKFTDREDKLKDNSRDLEFLTDSSKLYQIINGLIESNNKLKYSFDPILMWKLSSGETKLLFTSSSLSTIFPVGVLCQRPSGVSFLSFVFVWIPFLVLLNQAIISIKTKKL